MSNNYLVQISVGPVQDFIAEARKVRDLWVGSQVLSFISGKVLAALSRSARVILPATEHGSQAGVSSHNTSIPNQFLAIISEENLQTLSRNLEDSIRQSWNDLRNRAREVLDRQVPGAASSLKNWDSQLNDLWQCVWVATPISDDELKTKYNSKVSELQKALEARKATRVFAQHEGSSAFKCTQCGKRETMGPEDKQDSHDFWTNASMKSSGKVREGDRLCAVCLAKRFIDYQMIGLKKPLKFDSAADLAAASYNRVLEELERQHDKKELLGSANVLLKTLRQAGCATIEDIPGVLLFQEELTPELLLKEYLPWITKKDTVEFNNITAKIRQDLKAFKDSLQNINGQFGIIPSKYYALLAIDGDRMGQWLSTANSIDEQIAKSRLLSKLAVEMPDIVRQVDNRWATVYCGGDDLLAMGPLESALDVAIQAREAFVKQLGGTASAGLVILHYHNNLRKALEMLRDNVERAKEVHQRDSFVITVWLGSASFFTSGFKWDKIKKTIKPLLSWLNKGLSSAFIYDVLSEMDAFYDHRGRNAVAFESDMFIDEATRLFNRHLGNGQKFTEDAAELIKNLSCMADPRNVSYLKADDVGENFTNILRIGSFIDRQMVKKSK